jgi:ABC-type nickel/cobalt efflux system permease component RcnA
LNPLSILSRLVGANTTGKQITVSLVINLVTAAVSALLIVFLVGYFDGREARTLEPAPSIVYLVYVFLGLVAAWQLFSLAINLNLKTRFTRKTEAAEPTLGKPDTSPQALPSADFENVVPGSVAENRTEILNKSRPR